MIMSKNQQNKEPQIITLAKRMAQRKKELEALIQQGISPEELVKRGYKFVDAIKL